MIAVITTGPVLRYFVVGLDAAGKERGCPARAFSSAFELLHDHHRVTGVANLRPGRRLRPQDVARRGTVMEMVEEMNRVEWKPVRLGVTMHAGEDFVDPLTGLRQIAETVDLLGWRRHDRIGHALAAGLEQRHVREMLGRRAGGGEVESLGRDRYRLWKPRGSGSSPASPGKGS